MNSYVPLFQTTQYPAVHQDDKTRLLVMPVQLSSSSYSNMNELSFPNSQMAFSRQTGFFLRNANSSPPTLSSAPRRR